MQPLPDRYISARRNCAFGSSNLPNIEARWSSTKASPSLLLEAFGCTVGLDSEHLHHFIPEVIDSFTAIRPFLGLSNRREVSLVNVFLANRRLPSFVEFPLIKERIETELNPPSPPPESGIRIEGAAEGDQGRRRLRRKRQGRLPSRQPIAQERRQAGLQQLAATLNRSQRDWGVEGERSVVNQPRVTTGGGALPFPTGALPTHPLTPMARTIEQTAIRNFFMGPPFR